MAKKGAGRAAKAQRQNARKVYVRTTEPDVADSAPIPEPSVAPRPAAPAVAVPARPAASASYVPARSPVYTRRHATATPIPVDYSYVNHDLKRLGIIVGFIAVVMIALTFVLR